MPHCLICKIAHKLEKSYPVYEDKQFICFLDIRPVFFGHCLLSPKKHIETIYDLPTTRLKKYLFLIQNLGKAIETAMNAKGSFIAINNKVSQSIPHLHTHIIPRNFKDGLKGFFWPRIHYQDETEMQTIQHAIRDAFVTISK